MIDDQTKQKRLASINDEVGELHPLLAALIPKLPRIIEVERTHGNNEMGADFVVSRSDDTTLDIEYIGIVAKIGKITQDFTDVERQVDECSVERLFKNGKHKIRISEVWVIATGYISPNAQKKINDKYPTRKVLFIDSARLGKLIDRHLPNFWTEVPLLIGDFLHHVWVENDNLDRSLSLIPSRKGEQSFYVAQDIQESLPVDYTNKRRRRKVEILKELPQHPFVIVEGQFGTGKSKLLRKITETYAQPDHFISNRLLPLNITFKKFIDEYNLDTDKLVKAIVPEEIRNDPKRDFIPLVLIDGADEAGLEDDQLIKTLMSIAGNAKSAGARLVITLRSCDALENDAVLSKHFKMLELRELSLSRIIEFIQLLCRKLNIRSRLLEDLKKSTLFKELPKTPIAAILLAHLLEENAQELPSNLTELYSQYIELSLGRWDMDKGLATLKIHEALVRVLTTIAEDLMNQRQDELPVGEARKYFERYLSERNLGMNADELFDNALTRSDLVAIDKTKGTFRFKHRSFVEYLYARAHVAKTMAVDERVWTHYWSTSFYFYIGLQKDCPELLEAIWRVPAQNEGARWGRLLTSPDYLLAGYASPYSVIESCLALAFIDIARLYSDIVSGKVKSIVEMLPKMALVWGLHRIVRDRYGFTFFKNSFSGVACRVEEISTDKREVAIALFYLSLIGLELGDATCFDYLLKTYPQNMPIEFELGVKHIAEDMKNKTTYVRKLLQRVKRGAGQSRAYHASLDQLYQRPIKELPATTTKRNKSGS